MELWAAQGWVSSRRSNVRASSLRTSWPVSASKLRSARQSFLEMVEGPLTVAVRHRGCCTTLSERLDRANYPEHGRAIFPASRQFGALPLV